MSCPVFTAVVQPHKSRNKLGEALSMDSCRDREVRVLHRVAAVCHGAAAEEAGREGTGSSTGCVGRRGRCEVKVEEVEGQAARRDDRGERRAATECEAEPVAVTFTVPSKRNGRDIKQRREGSFVCMTDDILMLRDEPYVFLYMHTPDIH